MAGGQDTRGKGSEGRSADGGRTVDTVRHYRGAAKELGISRRLLYTWRDKLEPGERLCSPFGDHGDRSHHAVCQPSLARSSGVISQGSD